MRPSHLLDKATCRRALKDFLGALNATGLLTPFRRELGTPLPTQSIQYPGFNLFTGDTYKWAIPKPPVTVAEFAKTYERFADRSLGVVANPGGVIAEMYGGSHRARQVFTRRHDDVWMSPARCLLAASLWLGGEVETHSQLQVAVRFGNSLLEVTNRGCWVNGRGAYHWAGREAFDQFSPATTIDSIRYSHPVLTLMYKKAVEAGPKAEWACTVLATAMFEETIDRKWLLQQLVPPKEAHPVRSLTRAALALHECQQVLGAPGRNLVRRLYAAAVPDLMSAKDFQTRFGSRNRDHPNRHVKPETIERWTSALETVHSELAHAE